MLCFSLPIFSQFLSHFVIWNASHLSFIFFSPYDTRHSFFTLFCHKFLYQIYFTFFTFCFFPLKIPLVLYDCYFSTSLSLLGAIQALNWRPHIIVLKLACLAPCYQTCAQPPWLHHSQLPQGTSHQSCPPAPLIYLHPSHSLTHPHDLSSKEPPSASPTQGWSRALATNHSMSGSLS